MHPCLLNYYDRFLLTLSKVTEIVFSTVNNSLIMNTKTIQKLTTVYRRKNDISSTHRKGFLRMPSLYIVSSGKQHEGTGIPSLFLLGHQFNAFVSFLVQKIQKGHPENLTCRVLDKELTWDILGSVNNYRYDLSIQSGPPQFLTLQRGWWHCLSSHKDRTVHRMGVLEEEMESSKEPCNYYCIPLKKLSKP